MYYDYSYPSPFDLDMPGEFGGYPSAFSSTMGFPAGGNFPQQQQQRRGSGSSSSPRINRRSRSPQQPAAPSGFYADEDPFQGRDSIPIKVIHEYTTNTTHNKPSTETTPTAAQHYAEEEEPARREFANEEEEPKTIPVVHEGKPAETKRKPSPVGERTVPVTVLTRQEEAPAAHVEEVPPPKKRSLDQISCVEAALAELAPDIQAFSGEKGSYQYRYLDEMLTRNLIKLDDVETHGDEEVRLKRKEVVRKIEGLVQQLESNNKGVKADEPMETGEAKKEEPTVSTPVEAAEEPMEDDSTVEEKAASESTPDEEEKPADKQQSSEVTSTTAEAISEQQQEEKASEGEELIEEVDNLDSMSAVPADVTVEVPEEQQDDKAAEAAAVEDEQVEFEDVSDNTNKAAADEQMKDEQRQPAVVEVAADNGGDKV